MGLPGAFGTADAIVLSDDGETLTVVDYKNGYTEVDAERNAQLMLYALGALNGVELPDTAPEEDFEFGTDLAEDGADTTVELELTQEEIEAILGAVDPTLYEEPKAKPKKVKEVVEVRPCTVRTAELGFDDFEFDGEDLS
jgi:hypothetical protein